MIVVWPFNTASKRGSCASSAKFWGLLRPITPYDIQALAPGRLSWVPMAVAVKVKLSILLRLQARSSATDLGSPHMGCFRSSSFVWAGRWRVTAKRGEAQRSRERSDLDAPAAGYTVRSERAVARSWLPLWPLPHSFILALRLLCILALRLLCLWIQSVSPSFACSPGGRITSHPVELVGLGP